MGTGVLGGMDGLPIPERKPAIKVPIFTPPKQEESVPEKSTPPPKNTSLHEQFINNMGVLDKPISPEDTANRQKAVEKLLILNTPAVKTKKGIAKRLHEVIKKKDELKFVNPVEELETTISNIQTEIATQKSLVTPDQQKLDILYERLLASRTLYRTLTGTLQTRERATSNTNTVTNQNLAESPDQRIIEESPDAKLKLKIFEKPKTAEQKSAGPRMLTMNLKLGEGKGMPRKIKEVVSVKEKLIRRIKSAGKASAKAVEMMGKGQRKSMNPEYGQPLDQRPIREKIKELTEEEEKELRELEEWEANNLI